MKKIFFQIIFIFFFFNINNVYSSEKIHFIDLDLVIQKSIIGKNTLKKIENFNNKNIEELKKNEAELKMLDKNIKTKKNILSKEELDKELVILKEKINKYKNQKDIMVVNFEKQKNDNLKNFFDQINPIIQDFMKKNSIDILLESKNVFIGKNNLDITEAVIQEIDKRLN